MAATFTLSGDLATIVGDNFVKNAVEVYVEASEPAITDTSAHVTRAGSAKAAVNTDGTWSVNLIATNATDVIPAPVAGETFKYRALIKYRDARTSTVKNLATGWFDLTANLKFDAIDERQLTQVDAAFADDIINQVQASVDAAVAAKTAAQAAATAAQAVGTTNDTVIAGRINTPGSATATALSNSFASLLKPLATVTASTAPTVGKIARYDATGGALTGALPALTGGAAPAEGAVFGVQKTDSSANTVVISAAGSDTFDSGGTSLTLRVQNEIRTVQVVVVGGTKYWKVVGGNTPLTSLDLRYAPFGSTDPAIQTALNLGTALNRRVAGLQASPPTPVTIGALVKDVDTTTGRDLANVQLLNPPSNNFTVLSTVDNSAHNLTAGMAVMFPVTTGLFVDNRTYYVLDTPSTSSFRLIKDGASTGTTPMQVANPGTVISRIRVDTSKPAYPWDPATSKVASVYKVTEGTVTQTANNYFLGTVAVSADITQVTASAGGATIATTTTTINTVLTGTTQFEGYFIQAGSGADHTEVLVDGVLVDSVTRAQLTAAGLNNAVKLYSLPDTNAHLITVRQTGGRQLLGVRRVGGTFSYPTQLDSAVPITVSGDSFAEGTGDANGIGLTTWLAWDLNQHDVREYGVGGTGYAKDGPRLRLAARYQHDLIANTPANGVAIIAHGINDDKATQAQRDAAVAAATTIWDAFITQRPTARLIIVGPWSPKGLGYLETGIAELDTALNAAATARGLPFISPIQEGWITGNGRTGAPTGNGNSDLYIGGVDGTDQTHPSPAGHKYLGMRLSGRVAVIYPDLNRAYALAA